MTKKKIVSLCLAAVLVVMAIAGATVAYFTDTDSKDNTFTVGNVDITLAEPNWESSGSVDAPDVYPGEPLAKDPTVTNSGKNPCFVRISVDGLKQFGDKGDITYRTDYVTDKLGTDWVLHSDGYFYYTKVLAVGGTTDALFDQIVMPTGLTGGETAEDIVVTAQAVQAQGAKASFSAVEAMTVDEIAAWFTTCGF